MNAPTVDANSPSVPPEEPTVAGLRVRPVWTLALYAVLAASAALSVIAQRSPDIDPGVGRAAAWAFLVFAVGFAGYRLALVAARRYSPFKAFLQVLIAALFFVVLLVPAVQAPRPVPQRRPLLGHHEPAVRALAARVVGLEQDQAGASELVGLLQDPSPEVRSEAHAALVRLAGGVDLGTAPGPWKERFP